MKYLVAIISCEYGAYPYIENEGVRKTWTSKIPDELKVLFYYGKRGRNETVGDKVFLDCDEGDNCAVMQIKAYLFFEKILNEYKDLEYVFFTNLSSYVRLNKIVDMFKNINTNRYYSGLIGWHHSIQFASGAGFFISRDLLELIINNKQYLNLKVPGDVALGYFLTQSGVKIIPQNRFDVNCVTDKFTREDIINHYHFRCKQYANRSHDVIVMHKIHSLLNGE